MSKPNPFRTIPFPSNCGEYRVEDGQLVSSPISPTAFDTDSAEKDSAEIAPSRSRRTRSDKE